MREPSPTGAQTAPEADGEMAELLRRAEALGLEPEDLDGLVHDAASRTASAVNNDGLGSQIGFLVDHHGVDRARALIEDCRPGPLDDVADLRGSMIDGYTSETVGSVLGRVSDASGVLLVCVWDYVDDYGVGGNSQFYVQDAEGRLRELVGDLWPWLNGDPDDPDTPGSPGAPESWIGDEAEITTDELHHTDGSHNYARRGDDEPAPPTE